MADYWPWWLGALSLGGITIVYLLATGHSLGVSGAWERVLHWREEREIDRLDAAAASIDLEAALLAETAGHLGGDSAVIPAPAAPVGAAPGTETVAQPVTAQAVLLAAIFAGGLLASVASGRFELRADMGDAYREIVAGGPLMWPVLFVGGLLVGFGTRLAGGCSSGHGLSGCSRLQPPSLLATATFFGTAVVVSMLLWKVH